MKATLRKNGLMMITVRYPVNICLEDVAKYIGYLKFYENEIPKKKKLVLDMINHMFSYGTDYEYAENEEEYVNQGRIIAKKMFPELLKIKTQGGLL